MRCPTCQSPSPELHPSVQYDGEVELCTDAFHLSVTPQNKPEYVAAVQSKRFGSYREQMIDAGRGHLLRDTD